MDSESKELLQNTLNLVEENNKMLRKMRRAQKIVSFMRVVYWFIIIGIGIGAFYFLEPYFNKVINLFTPASAIEQKSNDNSFQDLLKKL